MTRTGDAWSLNIILDPYLHSCPTSISKCPNKHGLSVDLSQVLSRQKVPPLSPLSPFGVGWTHQKSSSPKDKPWEAGRGISKCSSKIYKPHILLRFSRAPRSRNHSGIFRRAQLQMWHPHELSLRCPLIQID